MATNLKSNQKATLSLAMIVKDEERWLTGCLQNIQPLVDEMIVVDTGSSDRTVEIAKKFTDKVYLIEWEDNFSKARNVSLEKATKDWILVLDADERIDPKDFPRIRQIINKPLARCYYLVQTNYCEGESTVEWVPNYLESDLAKDYPGYIESPLIRLFLNDPQIRFQGVIHEHARDAGCDKKAYGVDIRIHHYGKYTQKKKVEKKDNLYLKLGIQKCKEEPQNFQAWHELGVQYWSIGEKQKSLEALQKAHELNPRYVRTLIALGSYYYIENNASKAVYFLHQAMEIDPENILPYRLLPTLLFDLKKPHLAEAVVQQSYRFFKKHPAFLINSASFYLEIGNFNLAEEIVRDGYKRFPKNEHIQLVLGIVLTEKCQFEEAYTVLKKLAKESSVQKEASKRIAELFFRQKDLEKAKVWLDKLVNQDLADNEVYYQLAVVLIQQNKMEEAQDCLLKIKDFSALPVASLKNLKKCFQAINFTKPIKQIDQFISQGENRV